MNAHTPAQQIKTTPGAHDDAAARFIADEDGRIIHASPAMAALFGLRDDVLAGQEITALIDFVDADEVFHAGSAFGAKAAKLSHTIREGAHEVALRNSLPGETLIFRFDHVALGDGRRLLVGSADAHAEGHEITADFMMRVHEIVEHSTKTAGDKRAKIAERRKISDTTDEGELREFLNLSNDVMAVSSRDGKISRVNTTFNDLLGYTDEHLRRMTFADLIHPDDRAEVRRCLNALMHDESDEPRIIDFEARLIARDGRLHWMEWRQKRSGSVIYSVGRDVTAIKSHESALKVQQQQLSEAQEIARMGHWQWRVGAEYVEFSDEIYRIFGVERADFKPTLETMNAMLHRRDVGRLLQAFQRAIIERNNYDMEFRVIRPSGEVRYIRCEGRCDIDEHGDVTALFGIMQDITERTLYEKDLKEAKDSAERAYAAKSQFLANMSHELRTPLNAIIGFSEMMQRQLLGPIGSPRYLDYITGIRESGEHLLDLISDILDMSKIEAGKYELDVEELNAAKVIRLAAHMMEGRAQDAYIKLSVDIDDEDRQIVADRRAVTQILLNLLSNAVKFTEPGGSVRVECVSRPEHLIIRVHDTGIGIPANKLGNITRPFEQAASHYTRNHEGTGLGLSITKELVEMHGGALHIDSTVGVGTVVTVRLPYDAREAAARRATA